mmetsp:Transcript_28576/g.37422  ORF Transcript_28576/g.37422 Transcript_28576/m.37422 type:complete len:151 (+) Transcript_28576:86-538(+)
METNMNQQMKQENIIANYNVDQISKRINQISRDYVHSGKEQEDLVINLAEYLREQQLAQNKIKQQRDQLVQTFEEQQKKNSTFGVGTDNDSELGFTHKYGTPLYLKNSWVPLDNAVSGLVICFLICFCFGRIVMKFLLHSIEDDSEEDSK